MLLHCLSTACRYGKSYKKGNPHITTHHFCLTRHGRLVLQSPLKSKQMTLGKPTSLHHPVPLVAGLALGSARLCSYKRCSLS